MARVSIVDPTRLPIHTGNAQHIGRRDSQQDAWGFSNLTDETFALHGGYLAVLADGMGGLENGLWASSHGVGAFIAAYREKTPDEPISGALSRAMIHANRIVHAEAVRLGMEDRMGTTLVAAVVQGTKLYWISVGDSRVYLSANGQLLRLSTDHNFSEVLAGRVRRGEISLTEAQSHPMRNGLTSYLGRRKLAEVDMPTAPLDLHPGNWVLLCSDGLSGVLREDEIVRELRGDPQEAADRLVNSVLRRDAPHQDNTTAVLLQIPLSGGALSAGGRTITRPLLDVKSRRNLPVWVGLGALGIAVLLAGYSLIQPMLASRVDSVLDAKQSLPAPQSPKEEVKVEVVLPSSPNDDSGFEPKLDATVKADSSSEERLQRERLNNNRTPPVRNDNPPTNRARKESRDKGSSKRGAENGASLPVKESKEELQTPVAVPADATNGVKGVEAVVQEGAVGEPSTVAEGN